MALRVTQGPLARNSDSESSGGPVSQSARQEYEQSLRALREVIVKLMIPLRNTVQILKEEINATDQRTHKEKEEQVRWNSQTWATISELMGKSQEYARQIDSLNASSAHPAISINDSATLRNLATEAQRLSDKDQLPLGPESGIDARELIQRALGTAEEVKRVDMAIQEVGWVLADI